jgi:hypothetical protein
MYLFNSNKFCYFLPLFQCAKEGNIPLQMLSIWVGTVADYFQHNYTLYKNAGSWQILNVNEGKKWNVIYRYIMFGRGICEKYQSRDEIFPELNGERNVVSRLVFLTKFVNVISCVFYVTIVFALHRDACNKICKTLSVVRFM